MRMVSRALAIIRTLTAAWYFVGAALLFVLAAWLVGPIAHFWLPADIFALIIVWGGVKWVRRGCEELMLNQTRRTQ